MADLKDRAYLDLARRSLPGIPFYPLLTLLVVVLSDYAPGESLVLAALLALSVGVAVLRYRVCRRAPEEVRRDRAGWYREFASASMAQALSWSTFSFVGLVLSPSVTSADNFILLLCTAGIASGVPSSLAIDQRLAPAFLSALLLPPLPVILGEGSSQASALVVVFLLFWLYLIFQARRLGVDHSQLASQAILLEARAEQLRREVGEREAAEARALRSQRRFRDLVQEAPVGILELDQDGLIVESNVVGRSLLEVIGGRPNESLWLALGLATAPTDDGELTFRVGRDEDRWVALSHVPFEDLSLGSSSIVVLVDNTDQQRAEIEIRRAKEEAETASRMKSEFLAIMSHELRTPMNGIVGVADVLAEVDDPESQQEIVALLKSSTVSLLSVVERILDFAAIDSDEGTSEPFGVSAVLEQVLAGRREAAAETGLALEMNVSPAVPDVLEGDGRAVGRVLERLVENAVTYTETGRVDVNVRCQSSGDEWVELCFEVVDTGIGVPESAVEAIFRPFEQADGSMTRSHEGVGLGLAIASRLVERMGGELAVESEQGQGSRFFWTSRFQKLEEEESSAAPAFQVQKVC